MAGAVGSGVGVASAGIAVEVGAGVGVGVASVGIAVEVGSGAGIAFTGATVEVGSGVAVASVEADGALPEGDVGECVEGSSCAGVASPEGVASAVGVASGVTVGVGTAGFAVEVGEGVGVSPVPQAATSKATPTMTAINIAFIFIPPLQSIARHTLRAGNRFGLQYDRSHCKKFTRYCQGFWLGDFDSFKQLFPWVLMAER